MCCVLVINDKSDNDIDYDRSLRQMLETVCELASSRLVLLPAAIFSICSSNVTLLMSKYMQ